MKISRRSTKKPRMGMIADFCDQFPELNPTTLASPTQPAGGLVTAVEDALDLPLLTSNEYVFTCCPLRVRPDGSVRDLS